MNGPDPADQPVVILVEPQLPENVGATARAMANFGLSRLRLVKPRGGWPNDNARPAASGADHVLDGAVTFDDVAAATADLRFTFGTTARAREAPKSVRGPSEAARKLRAMGAGATGVLFGRERIGLTNDELSLCDEILTVPVDPTHTSLNIAQAVLIVAYEWRLSQPGVAESLPFTGANDAEPASKADLLGLFEHLEGALDRTGFFRPPEKRPHMVRSLRAMLHRASLTDQEVRTLRGVVAALEDRPTRPRPEPGGVVSTARRRDD